MEKQGDGNHESRMPDSFPLRNKLEHRHHAASPLRANDAGSPCCCYRISDHIHSRSSRLFSAFRHSTGSQMGKECYYCTASSPEPGSPGLLTDAGCLRRHAAYLFSDTAFLASKQPFYPLSFGHTRNASLFTSSPCHPFLMSFILCLSGIRFPNQASGFAS